MKIQHLFVMAKWWLAVALVMELLLRVGMAGGPVSLDEQFIEAAKLADLRLVKTLLAKGANVNAKSDSHQTALMLAAWTGDVKLVKLLLDKGADVNARGYLGTTALMESVGAPHSDTMKLLLDKGADVNAKDQVGLTTLIFAAMTGYVDVVKMLVDHGADVNAKSAFGVTALRQAEIRNDWPVVNLLKRAGAVNGRGEYDPTGPPVSDAHSPTENDSTTYPDSPEGVVRAFVNEALDDGPVTVEEMGLCNEILLVQNKYFFNDRDLSADPNDDDLDPSRRLKLGNYHITNGFEIKAVKKDKDRATVKVLYRRLGWIWCEPMHITECRSSRTPEAKQTTKPSGLLEAMIKSSGEEEGEVWDKERCRFLHITNDTQEVTYSLAKPGKIWRIIDSYDPYISVSSAIKLLKCTMRHRPNVSTAYPSKAQKIEITQDIGTLEQHLSR